MLYKALYTTSFTSIAASLYTGHTSLLVGSVAINLSYYLYNSNYYLANISTSYLLSKPSKGKDERENFKKTNESLYYLINSFTNKIFITGAIVLASYYFSDLSIIINIPLFCSFAIFNHTFYTANKILDSVALQCIANQQSDEVSLIEKRRENHSKEESFTGTAWPGFRPVSPSNENYVNVLRAFSTDCHKFSKPTNPPCANSKPQQSSTNISNIWLSLLNPHDEYNIQHAKASSTAADPIETAKIAISPLTRFKIESANHKRNVFKGMSFSGAVPTSTSIER